MKCLLFATALVAHTSASEFDGLPEIIVEQGEMLKQVTRRTEFIFDSELTRNAWDRTVTVHSIDGDIAEIDDGFVLTGDMECGDD